MYRHDAGRTGTADAWGGIHAPYERFDVNVTGHVISSPAVASVSGETRVYFATYVNTGVAGTIYSVDGHGDIVWTQQPVGSTGGYVSSPAVADLDGDGAKELVIANLDDSNLRILDAATGSVESTTSIGQAGEDLLGSSPLVADLLPDQPGEEIALGGSRGGSPGDLIILGSDGAILQTVTLDGPSWSSPVLANLDADPAGELLLATGLPSQLTDLFPNAKTGGRSLYALDRGPSGTWSIMWNLTLSGPTLATPAVADLDADGTPEVALGAEGGTFYIVEGTTGRIEDTCHQDDPDATTHGCNSVDDVQALASPAAADVDEDGRTEVVVGTWHGLASFEHDGTNLTRDARLDLPEVPAPDGTNTSNMVLAGVALGDVTGDGHLDVLGLTQPLHIQGNDPTQWQALPGHAFAVDGRNLGSMAGVHWVRDLPKDGGLSGPVLADLDGDGPAEVLVGEGIPVIGDGGALHAYAALNPIILSTSNTPTQPTDLDDVSFSSTVAHEDPSGSDALTYRWSFGDGTTRTEPEPTHRFPDDGNYTVELTVEDGDGSTWNLSRTLHVRNVPPELDLQADTTLDDLNVTLHGNPSDPDGTVANTTWSLGDGARAVGASVNHTYDTGGTYDVLVSTTDDDNATTTGTMTVTVNRLPHLEGPTNATGEEGTPLTLAFNATDADGDDLEVASIEGAPNATHTWTAQGLEVTWTPSHDVANRTHPQVTVPVNVTVADDGSPTGTSHHEVPVTVHHVNRAPTLEAPDTATAVAGHAVEVDGTVVDPDGNPVTLQVTADGFDPILHRDGDAWTTQVDTSLEDAGTTFTLHVTADDGVDVRTHNITVDIAANLPPTPRIDGPSIVNVTTWWNPSLVRFDGSGSTDPEDTITTWTWTQGTRELQGDTMQLKFPDRGAHDLTLEVMNDLGQTAATTRTILVDDAITGHVDVHLEGGSLTGDRTVTVQVLRDDGTPVAGGQANLTMRYPDLYLTTASHHLALDDEGRASVTLDGDLGTGLWFPGEHRVTVTSSAPSSSDAVLQDTEHLRMVKVFYPSP